MVILKLNDIIGFFISIIYVDRVLFLNFKVSFSCNNWGFVNLFLF